MWDIFEKISIILAISLPIVSFLAYTWKLKKENSRLKQDILELQKVSSSFSDGENVLDAIMPNAETVKIKILEIISNSAKSRSGVLRIDNMGLDLETVHTMFSYTFNEKFSGRSIEYRGLIIDPENDRVKQVTNASSNLDIEVASRVINSMKNPSQQISENLRNSDIKITKYPDIPIMHGFLIDDEHLFLGFSHFEQGGLVGGNTPYIYVQRDIKSEFKKELFSMYSTWFDHYWNSGKKCVHLSKGESKHCS